LPCAQPDRTSVTTNIPDMRSDPNVLGSHARELREVASMYQCVLFVLDVPIATAVDRRMDERGPSWFETYLEHEPPTSGDDTVRNRMIRWFETGRPRHLDCVDAHAAGGWAIQHLDATAP